MSDIEEAFALTLKELGKILGDQGGFFYFAGDPSGKEAALLVLSESKDGKGTKTLSRGKKLRTEMRKISAKAKFCHGRVSMDGARLVFEISGGSAGPALMKSGLRKSRQIQKEGLLGRHKRAAGEARIQVAGQAEPEVSLSSDEATKRLVALGVDPREIASLGISEAELNELLAAETRFAELSGTLSDEAIEASSGELERLTDQAVSEISAETTSLLDLLESGKLDEALELESATDTRRQLLAQLHSSGPDLFDGPELSPVGLETLHLALNSGIRIVEQRALAVLARAEELNAEDDSPTPTMTGDEIQAERALLRTALATYRAQLESLRWLDR